MDNAFKYSEPGTPVTVSWRQEPGLIAIEVADEGCGIAADEVSHIFEPFYRSTEARRLGKPGVGLGLAVSQRIAAAFGSTLSFDSQLAQGSRFILRVPAVAASPVPEAVSTI